MEAFDGENGFIGGDEHPDNIEEQIDSTAKTCTARYPRRSSPLFTIAIRPGCRASGFTKCATLWQPLR